MAATNQKRPTVTCTACGLPCSTKYRLDALRHTVLHGKLQTNSECSLVSLAKQPNQRVRRVWDALSIGDVLCDRDSCALAFLRRCWVCSEAPEGSDAEAGGGAEAALGAGAEAVNGASFEASLQALLGSDSDSDSGNESGAMTPVMSDHDIDNFSGSESD